MMRTRGGLIVGLVVCVVGGAWAQAPKATTDREFRAKLLEWNRETTVGAYETVGVRNPAWDQDAVALLDLCAQSFSGVEGGPWPDELLAAAEPLMNSNCGDPLVLYCIGVALHLNERATEAEPFVMGAVEGFRESKYPRCRAWAAPLRLAKLCLETGLDRKQESEQWLDLAVAWLLEAVDQGSYEGEQRRFFWVQVGSEVNDGVLAPRAAEIQAGLAKQPEAEPWMRQMVAGVCETHEAWEARGSGWGSQVTEAGWRGFRQHLAAARRELTAAWEAHPECPEAATQMMTVALGTGDDDGKEVRLWFSRARAAQFDYMPAYGKMVWSLYPRWYGSIDAMYDFGRDCLKTGRFDTRVPEYLLTVIRDIDEEGHDYYWRRGDVYEDMSTLFDGLLSEPTREDQRPWLRSLRAAVAWRAGRYDEARKLLDELGDELQEEAFTDWFHTSMKLARGEIYAATGPLKRQVLWAEELARYGRYSEALYLYEHLPQPPEDDLTAFYISDRLVTWKMEDEEAPEEP